MEKHSIPLLQIRPNCLIKYNLCEYFTNEGQNISNPYLHKKHDLTKESNKVKGELSNHSIRRLRLAINLLHAISQRKRVEHLDGSGWYWFRLNFITLTIPIATVNEPDEKIKKECLNYFLTDCRRKYGLRHYVWKAEAQANGNIHFHITSNCWIHWQQIRSTWNKALERCGFISEYKLQMNEWHKNGFNIRTDLLKNWSYEDQKRAYESGCENGWTNPNTTDVHAVKTIRNLAAYIVKYMCKNETGRRSIGGKLWDCSKSLKVSERLEYVLDSVNTAYWNVMKEKAGNDYRKEDCYELIFTSPDTIKALLPPKFLHEYENYLSKIRGSEG